MEQANDGHELSRADADHFAVALAEWMKRTRDACSNAATWPERVGAGLYAAIAFLVEEPQMATSLLDFPTQSRLGERYRRVVRESLELLEEAVPVPARAGPGGPSAAIAGIALVAGDRLRAGQAHQLAALLPEMHLMVLLQFLGFEEAKLHAEEFRSQAAS
ncbi:MAG TPA: hypothetical protein VFN85_02410 [Solirubrobacterales bacterium]|nr:hypothetical protein [Solirubrobacterales bacterium]